MATFTVTTLSDTSNPVDGELTLREAIELANTTPGSDDIFFEEGLSGTITLVEGEIEITDEVRVFGESSSEDELGNDRNDITVSGDTNGNGVADAGDTRIFNVSSDAIVFQIDLTNGYFDNSGAEGPGGGGAVLHTDGTLGLYSVDVTDSAVVGAGGSGGAILSSGEDLEFLGGALVGNSAVRAGGAIELADGADAEISTFAFDNTVGDGPGNGGVLHVTGAGSNVFVSLGVMGRNSASSEGGALWNDAGSTLTVSGTLFFDNEAGGDAADNGGGAIFNNGGTLVVRSDEGGDEDEEVITTEFENNEATGAAGSGGAILSTGGSVTIEDASFDGNSANRAGGAIEVIDGTVTIDGSDFDGNVTGDAPGNGGALHVTGMDGTLVEVSNSSFENNLAANEGGALWNQAGSTMTVTDSTFDDNTAQGDAADNGGGAIFNNGGTLSVGTSSFASNDATGSSGSGGAILSTDGDVTITDSEFDFNASVRAGGAIEIIDGTMDITGSEFDNNATGTVPGNGGALHVTGMDGTVVNVADSSFTRNEAAAEGGALWNQAGSTLNVRDSRFEENFALGDAADNGGGAIFNNGGTLTVDSSVLVGNGATGMSGSGGAMLSVDGDVTITDSEFEDNEASRAGGAIEVIDGTVDITDSVLFGNETGSAPGNGGALHVSGMDGTVVNVSNSEVYANTASNEGGGLWNQAGSTMNVVGSSIYDNSAFGDVDLDGGADFNSVGGGGIFNNGGELTVTDSAVYGNEATGQNSGGGGILAVEGSTTTVVNTTVEGNRAVANGAGVGATGDSVLTLTNTTVTGNGGVNGSTPFVAAGGSAVLRLANTIVLGNATNESVTGIEGTMIENSIVFAEEPEDVFAAVDPATGGGLLADNGGPVQTVALLADADNPALDAGDDAVAPATDARGEARVDQDAVDNDPGRSDLGAFELQEQVEGDGGDVGNVIIGTPGNDFLFGTPGQDTIRALGGDDQIVGRGGDDIIDGGAGTDEVRYNGATTGAGVNLATGNSIGAASDTFISIETFRLTEFNDFFIGNEEAQTAFAGAGDDQLFGRGGDDRLFGREGDDVLGGGAGNDRVSGGAGNDRISGNSGDDVLTGGEGEDTFVFAFRFGFDRVGDFEVGTDTLVFESVRGAGGEMVDSFDDLLITQSGPTTFIRIDANNDGIADSADRVQLNFVDADELTADDFMFA